MVALRPGRDPLEAKPGDARKPFLVARSKDRAHTHLLGGRLEQ